MLRKILGQRKRKLEDAENCIMKSSVILLLTNSKMMKWTGNVLRHEYKRNANSVLVGKLEKKDNLEDTGISRRIMLK
jgi:hypothetical protein